MSLSRRFCGLAGCRLPIVQAPIGGVASPELAAAVANAGGLGSLALTWRSPAEVIEAVRASKSLTSGPLNGNFVLQFDVDDQFLAALDEGVEVVSFFWGDPGPMIQRALQAGAVPITVVGSVDEAKRAADRGAEAIVAQGWEAGGHVRGEVAMSVLVPAVADAVPGLPVLAAGGIADARGVAAAFALGAAGVWVGTRFVASFEANSHPDYHEALVRAAAEDTVHSCLFDGGWPDAAHRTLRNSTVRAWEEAGRQVPGQRPGEREPVGSRAGRAVERYNSDAPTRAVEQGAEGMALYAGQSAGLVNDILPAAQIVAELAKGLPTGENYGAPGDLERGGRLSIS